MKIYEKCNEEAIREIYKVADENVIFPGDTIDNDKLTYIFKDVEAICTFRLVKDMGFKNLLLRSCYGLTVTFYGLTQDGKSYIQPFSSERAKKIVKKFFPETESVWEHAPFTDKGASSQTHYFYLFVSIPYGKKIVKLKPLDMQA